MIHRVSDRRILAGSDPDLVRIAASASS